MKRPWVLAIVAANLAVFIALAFAYPSLMVSPGPLIPAHQELTTNCFACHAPLRGAAAERCVSCHLIAEIGLKTTKGVVISRTNQRPPFHQALVSQNCMACHSDHPGLVFSGMDPPRFSHAALNPDIDAKCSSCHSAPDTSTHRGLTAECSQCHNQQSWKQATLDHSKFFVLDHNHNATCVTCHATKDFKQYTCYGCHEHSEAGIRAKHLKEGIRNFETCVSCHRSARGKSEGGGEED
jgi:hypothetical protein